MPRDWDEDAWYDDNDFPPVRSERGRGGVVATAVVTFVMCGFNALSSTCLFFCGFMSAAMGGNPNKNNGVFLPGNLLEHTAIILLALGIASAVSFVAQIIAGIGLINNKRWARTLSFYLGGYSFLMSLFLIYLVVTAFAGPAVGDDAFGTAIWIMGLVFHGGYAGTVFIVLNNSRVAASLR